VWAGSVSDIPNDDIQENWELGENAINPWKLNLHFLKSLEFVRWEHYKFRYNTSNGWAFLGNGRVKAEITKDIAKLTPYIRKSDEPWGIE